MKKIINSDSTKIILAILVLMTLATIIFPLIIKGFFMGLLFMMNNPKISLAIIGAFLLGMWVNEKADKLDNSINNL